MEAVGEYTRSTLYSNIGYLEPEYLSPETSLYRDNAHNASALVDLALPGYAKLMPVRFRARLACGQSWPDHPNAHAVSFPADPICKTTPIPSDVR
jgi:hypothetical protein